MTQELRYPVCPVGKPRMTRRDRWKKRPAVLRYRAFKDECRLRRITVQEDDEITFIIPMPKSWPQWKRAELRGQRHRNKPDIDNLLKALMDAVLVEDSHIARLGPPEKLWGEEGAIIIRRAA